jgi:ribosomal protein S18 acetylase RimI-like enzyme
VKAAGWRTTYAPWVEPQVLDPFLDEERQRAAVETMIAQPGNVVLVAAAGGEVVGFATCLVSDDADPYLDSLHVAADARGRGLGSRLLREVAGELGRRGRTTLALDVVEQNRRARALYKRLGGVFQGVHPAEWAPETVVEARYRWADLSPLDERTFAR